MSRTFVIAEAAACHDKHWDKAIRLVHLARAIGADACKFQWLSSVRRLTERRHAGDYAAAYENIAFPIDWLADLRQACDTAGVEFMVTVYLCEDLPVIAPLVRRFKIASFEAEDQEFVLAHGPYDRETLISVGMGARPYFGPALRFARYLHCVSAYPAPAEAMNLRRCSSTDGPPISGLSDHSRHPWTGALAVAAGARIIEFHVRLDDTDPGNADYAVARTPAEAREYVANIRTTEILLGDGVQRVMACEEPMLRYRVSPA